LLSVLLHGITAAPLSAAYAHRVEGMAADAPEKQGATQASATRWFGLSTDPARLESRTPE
jgi:hypothetical protein